MRFCGGFLRREQVSCPKQGHQTGSFSSQSVRSALLAIDRADRDSALETGLADRVERLDQGAARRDNILDEAYPLALLEHALEPVRRPVVLGRLAHDQKWKTGRQRGC